MSIELPPLEEARALLQKMSGGQFQIVDFRVLKMVAEYVEYSKDQGAAVRTFQSHEEEGDAIRVRTEFRTFIPLKDNPSPDAAPIGSVSLGFALGVAYRVSGTVDPITRTVFGKANGVTHAWPYWRTFVFSSMAQMGATSNLQPLVSLDDALRMAGFQAKGSTSNATSPQLPSTSPD